jgi:hypothetical protein
MNPLAHGKHNSEVEIGNISAHGVWLIAHNKELFMPYESFPWFKDQRINSIINVEEQSPGHYYWPELDVDLTDEIIEHPERFPRISLQEQSGTDHD